MLFLTRRGINASRERRAFSPRGVGVLTVALWHQQAQTSEALGVLRL